MIGLQPVSACVLWHEHPNGSLADKSSCCSQAVGATTPAFTVLLAWLINGHLESYRVCCALIPVVAGIVITSGFEPSFHVVGLLFLLSSTAARAYKSLLQARSNLLLVTP